MEVFLAASYLVFFSGGGVGGPGAMQGPSLYKRPLCIPHCIVISKYWKRQTIPNSFRSKKGGNINRVHLWRRPLQGLLPAFLNVRNAEKYLFSAIIVSVCFQGRLCAAVQLQRKLTRGHRHFSRQYWNRVLGSLEVGTSLAPFACYSKTRLRGATKNAVGPLRSTNLGKVQRSWRFSQHCRPNGKSDGSTVAYLIGRNDAFYSSRWQSNASSAKVAQQLLRLRLVANVKF